MGFDLFDKVMRWGWFEITWVYFLRANVEQRCNGSLLWRKNRKFQENHESIQYQTSVVDRPADTPQDDYKFRPWIENPEFHRIRTPICGKCVKNYTYACPSKNDDVGRCTNQVNNIVNAIHMFQFFPFHQEFFDAKIKQSIKLLIW